MDFGDVYRLFFNPGEVAEIRAYGLNGSNKKVYEGFAGGEGIVFGYFDNPESFAEAAAGLEAIKAPGIYFTLNPVISDFLAKSHNRLRAVKGKTTKTTPDKHIQCIRWVPIDLDPQMKLQDGSYVKRGDISSTREELTEAIRLRKKIAAWLKKDFKLEPAIPAVSGNGCHLMLRLPDLPLTNRDRPDQCANVLLVKGILQAIHAKMGCEAVEIDQVVFNPARIWKLYGTTVRKGDPTQERPHRKSYVEPKWMEQ